MGEASQNIAIIYERKVFNTPYCENCYPKVIRRSNLEGNLALISVFITVPAVIIFLIVGAVRNPDILVKGSTCGVVLLGSLLLLSSIFILGKLCLFVYFHFSGDRTLSPGVKITKTKHPATVELVFSNPQYAQRFSDANGLN